MHARKEGQEGQDQEEARQEDHAKAEAAQVLMAKKTTKKLTKRQESALKRHGQNHTAKHMTLMRTEMRKGSTFAAAHKKAQKKVGK